METGASITGNYGSGVYNKGGIFTMNNGTISGNIGSGSGGGGVHIDTGTFTMNNGTISDNSTAGYGGGVWIAGGAVFTMNGGTISNNAAQHSIYGGGGVIVGSNSTFVMEGGTITADNTATVSGKVLYKVATATAVYGNDQPILEGAQNTTLWIDAALTGHN